MQFHGPVFRIRRVYFCLVPLVALLLLGGDHADPGSNCRHTHEDLDAVLWMETSAEYYDCATQAYKTAKIALLNALGDPNATAAVEQTNPFDKLPPAIILDVDETVLDNSPFQAWLVKYSQPYKAAIWNEWVSAGRSKAIPGAVEFTQFAKDKHVAVFFVTNRDVASKKATVKNLRDCGFPVEAEGANVLCTNETQLGTNTKWTSDKIERRRFLCAKYRILLQFGDQLGDFISSDTLGTADRRQLAKSHASFWGEKWIALPNPTYGRWQLSLLDSPVRLSDVQALEREYGAMNVWNHPAPTP
jgi:5'-nucleotidase (lipoprotein e(P4) family)